MMENSSGSKGATPSPAEGLRIESVHLSNFRNLPEFVLEDICPLTILVGPNAVGKTSVVEAVQMMTALSSFRTSKYSQMILWDEDCAHASARFEGSGRILDLDLSLRDGKRAYKLNGKARRVQDLKGLMPAVSFNPDDLGLVKGSNSGRRDAVDHLGAQLSRNFYSVRNDYAKLLRQRNRALKDAVPDVYLDSIDDLLVRVAAQLMAYRTYILWKMTPAFAGFYHDISAGGESLGVTYEPSWSEVLPSSGNDGLLLLDGGFDKARASDLMRDALQRVRPQERSRGKTVIGPHADKISFTLDARDALHFSSQGQQRSIVLAFKLAEALTIEETLGQRPVLLLDDVLSELDEERRRYFLRFISDEMQAFITTTNAEFLAEEIRRKADFVHLEKGRVVHRA